MQHEYRQVRACTTSFFVCEPRIASPNAPRSRFVITIKSQPRSSAAATMASSILSLCVLSP